MTTLGSHAAVSVPMKDCTTYQDRHPRLLCTICLKEVWLGPAGLPSLLQLLLPFRHRLPTHATPFSGSGQSSGREGGEGEREQEYTSEMEDEEGGGGERFNCLPPSERMMLMFVACTKPSWQDCLGVLCVAIVNATSCPLTVAVAARLYSVLQSPSPKIFQTNTHSKKSLKQIIEEPVQGLLHYRSAKQSKQLNNLLENN